MADDSPAHTAVLEELGPCKKLLKIEVDQEEVQKEIDGRIRELRKNVHLKGFRPGKAPKSRIEKLYGKRVRDDARDHLLRASYHSAIEKEIGERNLIGGPFARYQATLPPGTHTLRFASPEHVIQDHVVNVTAISEQALDVTLVFNPDTGQPNGPTATLALNNQVSGPYPIYTTVNTGSTGALDVDIAGTPLQGYALALAFHGVARRNGTSRLAETRASFHRLSETVGARKRCASA